MDPSAQTPPDDTARTTRSRWRAWQIATWAAAFAALASVIQFVFVPSPIDADTAYHFAVGRLIRDHGLLRAFPWTTFSWLSGHYADKELAFHLLFVPLAGLYWITAAHVVGAIAGAAALLALYAILRAQGVRFAGLWALTPLAASPAFVFRFVLVRPHLLSIALALIVLWAASNGRLAVLALASVLYPWCYVAWILPVGLVLVAEAARVLSGQRPRWQPLATVAGGLLVGLALHPNGANLVHLSWIQLVDVLVRNAWGAAAQLELGDEFRAFTLREWARLLLAPAAMAIAALVLAVRDRRQRPEGLAFALAATAFAVATLRTARFTEYFVPFAVAALALASRGLRFRWAGPMVLVASLAYGGAETTRLLTDLRQGREALPPEKAAQLAARVPPGAQVFTCDWGLTGVLMVALPERRFVVALDPTFFQKNDPTLYDLWYRLPREAPPGLAATIRERFGARFVICPWDERFRKFFDRIAFEPGVRTILLDDVWNAYELGEP